MEEKKKIKVLWIGRVPMNAKQIAKLGTEAELDIEEDTSLIHSAAEVEEEVKRNDLIALDLSVWMELQDGIKKLAGDKPVILLDYDLGNVFQGWKEFECNKLITKEFNPKDFILWKKNPNDVKVLWIDANPMTKKQIEGLGPFANVEIEQISRKVKTAFGLDDNVLRNDIVAVGPNTKPIVIDVLKKLSMGQPVLMPEMDNENEFKRWVEFERIEKITKDFNISTLLENL